MRARNFTLPPLGCCVPLLLLFSGILGSLWALSRNVDSQAAHHWKLSWQDEFDQPDGSRPNPAKWAYDLGGNGWGNHELEYYTDDVKNASASNGKLTITAIQEKKGSNDYTSARITSKNCFWLS